MPASVAAELLLFHLQLRSPPLDAAATARLRSALHQYVDELRRADWPIDQVVVSVKRLAAHAGVRPSSALPLLDEELEPADRLLIDMLRWSVEAYYD